jgi:nucleosome binding factor SPN SPT16 subunit
MRNASKACIALMNPYFVEEMSNVLDEEKKVKHSKLANDVDSKLDDNKFWTQVELPNKQKMPSDFDPAQLDWTHGPIIQSGGKFDLKMTAQVDDEILHAGVILAIMGLRYKQYCSIIARTYLVDPNKSQESNYKLLLQVHSLVMKEVRDGAVVKDIYNKALALVKARKPDLERHFLKNVGAGIGIETKDNTLILNGKNSRTLKDGMTLCITTGFNDIENPSPQDKKSKVYSMVLSDTVRVTTSDPVVFTGDAPSELDATSFFFKDEEEEKPTPKKEKKDSKVGAVATTNIVKSKLRAERTTQTDEGAEARRREHQKELAQKKQEEGLARYAEATDNQNGAAVKKFKRFESYKRDNQFPSRIKDLAIVMDQKNSTIVLPIMGRPVPFHIQTIKNASKSDEGEWAYLRINFLSPGQGVGRKEDQPFEDASAHFVRSLTFRSHDGDRLNDIATQIANMKKDAVKREQEKKEMEDVVEQDKLVEIRSEYRMFIFMSFANIVQIVARPLWIMSSSVLSWMESESQERSRFIKMVSATNHLLTPNIASIFFSATSSIFSSSLVNTNLLSSSTSISKIRSSSARRRPRMSNSTVRPQISNSMRLETESASTDMATRKNLRPNKKNADVVLTSTANSNFSHKRLRMPERARTSTSTSHSENLASTVSHTVRTSSVNLLLIA